MNTSELIKTMHETLNELLWKPKPNSPAKSMRASDIGFPCDLYHVRNFLDWEHKLPFEPSALRNFEMGRIIEKEWILRARQIWRIYDEQKSLEWRKYNISGTIDGRIEIIEGKPVVFDVKSMHPNIWAKFDENNPDGWRELLKSPYFMKAPAQGQIYMLLENQEQFLFILVNKSNLAEKFLFMPLDFEFAETLVKRAERVMKYVKAEKRPDPIEYDETLCGKLCPYRHICLPDKVFDGAEFVEDEDIKEAFIRYFELKEFAKEYEEVNAYLKAQLGKYSKGGFCDNGNFEFAIKEIFYKAQPQKVILPKEERVEKRVFLIDHRKNTKQI